uniref:Sorting nexin-5-like n=1 Tax=Hirondellea gigas TaxID=1518452 RepID=A0A6A7G094_9CRUS
MMQDVSESPAVDGSITQLADSEDNDAGNGTGLQENQEAAPEEGSSNGGGSGSSSPEPPEPWSPRYTATFSEHVVKDGAAVTFTIIVKQNDLTIQVLQRVYEDFEYLEHCVITDQPSDGIIVPPLPARPTTDAALTETTSKKHMGKGSKTLLADNFQKNRLQLQRYLELLLSHPVLGRSNRLESFLTVKQAPPRAKMKRGLLAKLSDSLETRRAVVPDCEEFFQRERAWITRALPLTLQFDAAFHQFIYANQRLLQQSEYMVTALRLFAGPSNTKHECSEMAQLTHAVSVFIQAMETNRMEGESELLEVECSSGAGVELWRRQMEAEGSMLQGRTTLLLSYQHCNRALDKAKPNRKEAAEKAKKGAEEAFESCSDVARHEIKRLHRIRCAELTELLLQYGRLQLAAATRRRAVLATALTAIKADGQA